MAASIRGYSGPAMLCWAVCLPLLLIFHPSLGKIRCVVTASLLVILGSFALLYVFIIGGQAFPLSIFPGYEVSSSFGDGQIASYTPSLPEFLLGFGGIAIAFLITTIGVRVIDSLLPHDTSDRRKLRRPLDEPDADLRRPQVFRQNNGQHRLVRCFERTRTVRAALQERAGLHRPDVAVAGLRTRLPQPRPVPDGARRYRLHFRAPQFGHQSGRGQQGVV